MQSNTTIAPDNDDPAFDSVGAGVYLGGVGAPLSPKTLANMRTSGTGPEFERIGSGRIRGRIRYRKSALDAWRATRRRRSTSEVSP
jgi:hypothetical protein